MLLYRSEYPSRIEFDRPGVCFVYIIQRRRSVILKQGDHNCCFNKDAKETLFYFINNTQGIMSARKARYYEREERI